jgi:peptidyl-tRNA hydrolase
MKQVIVIRKDLNMSKGKFGVQVAHASNAFFMDMIKKDLEPHYKDGYLRLSSYAVDIEEECENIPAHYCNNTLNDLARKYFNEGKRYFCVCRPSGDIYEEVEEVKCDYYTAHLPLSANLVEEWLDKDYIKIVLSAKNKKELLKIKTKAEESGVPVFPIYDKCYTELTPEEEDGTTLTSLGFPPLEDVVINPIIKRLQLYKE